MQQRYTSESRLCDGSFNDAHDGSILLGLAPPMWTGDRHGASEAVEASSSPRDMSWVCGALAAYSWRLNEQSKLSCSLGALKLVTVGGQVHTQSPDLPRSFPSSVGCSIISLAMTRSSSYQDMILQCIRSVIFENYEDSPKPECCAWAGVAFLLGTLGHGEGCQPSS
jgi:hypothetical protein